MLSDDLHTIQAITAANMKLFHLLSELTDALARNLLGLKVNSRQKQAVNNTHYWRVMHVELAKGEVAASVD